MPAPEPPASAGARLINGTTDCSVRALVSLLALSAIACSPSTSSPAWSRRWRTCIRSCRFRGRET